MPRIPAQDLAGLRPVHLAGRPLLQPHWLGSINSPIILAVAGLGRSGEGTRDMGVWPPWHSSLGWGPNSGPRGLSHSTEGSVFPYSPGATVKKITCGRRPGHMARTSSPRPRLGTSFCSCWGCGDQASCLGAGVPGQQGQKDLADTWGVCGELRA